MSLLSIFLSGKLIFSENRMFGDDDMVISGQAEMQQFLVQSHLATDHSVIEVT